MDNILQHISGFSPKRGGGLAAAFNQAASSGFANPRQKVSRGVEGQTVMPVTAPVTVKAAEPESQPSANAEAKEPEISPETLSNLRATIGALKGRSVPAGGKLDDRKHDADLFPISAEIAQSEQSENAAKGEKRGISSQPKREAKLG